MRYTHASLCQINHTGCFGCCGHDFGTMEEIDSAIRNNGMEYEGYADKREWMNRSEELHDCGICKNIIRFADGKLGCPLHPAVQGEDMRIGHCDIAHLCKAAELFDRWDSSRQERFLDFIEKKKLNWYDYSIRIDNDELIEEFEAIS
jgi:hypothetical protein